MCLPHDSCCALQQCKNLTPAWCAATTWCLEWQTSCFTYLQTLQSLSLQLHHLHFDQGQLRCSLLKQCLHLQHAAVLELALGQFMVIAALSRVTGLMLKVQTYRLLHKRCYTQESNCSSCAATTTGFLPHMSCCVWQALADHSNCTCEWSCHFCSSGCTLHRQRI